MYRLLAITLFSFFLVYSPFPVMALDEGEKIISFKGYDLNGQALDLEQMVGKKPIMLIFWASWCPSCRAEVPKINELAKTFNGSIEFVGVNVGFNDSYERAKKFASKTGMQYPALFDATGAIGQQYMLQGVPTIVIADKKGVVRYYGHSTPDISQETFQKLTLD